MVQMYHCEVQIIGRCNLRCANCQYYAPLQDWVGDTDKILQYITLARSKLQVEWFPICGVGEPLLHPDLPVIIEEACRYPGFASRVSLVTNGVNLTYSRHRKALLSLHEQYSHFDLVVSEHVPIPETKEWLRKHRIRSEVRSNYPFVKKQPGFPRIDKHLAWNTGSGGDNSGPCFKSRCRAIKSGKIYRCAIHASRYVFINEFDGISLESPASQIHKYLTDMPYDECCFCSSDLEQTTQSQMTDKELEQYRFATIQ
jgi:hypothetical protein